MPLTRTSPSAARAGAAASATPTTMPTAPARTRLPVARGGTAALADDDFGGQIQVRGLNDIRVVYHLEQRLAGGVAHGVRKLLRRGERRPVEGALLEAVEPGDRDLLGDLHAPLQHGAQKRDRQRVVGA